MRHGLTWTVILSCFGALFLICYAPVLFLDRQFGYRDVTSYYYPLNKRVQAEWSAGRWPLWEPEENAGMPLLGNPTAAVLYPGKLVFAILPYAWGARTYVVAHSALAFLSMLVLMRSWGTSWIGSAQSALSYAFGAPILFQYCNIIYLIGAAWLPLGIHAIDRWVRLGRRWGLVELAIVLSMQVLGGEPQAAYLLGLAGIGYAALLAWNRATFTKKKRDRAQPTLSRHGVFLLLVAIVPAVWCVFSVALAYWLPKVPDLGKPSAALDWMPWAPVAVNAAWGLAAVVFLVHCWRRGWRSPLGVMWLGLAGSACLAIALTAAQLLPVVEFTQQTGRSLAGPYEIYQYTLDPCQLVEIVWPNVLGTPFGGNDYWRDVVKTPGGRPSLWIPSLYMGGLTVALALSAIATRHGPPWRVWLTALAGMSLLGSLGQYTSPIWLTRAVALTSSSATLRTWLPDLGPLAAFDSAPIRLDGYPRDSDGCVYWWLSTVLPGFRQFRYPAKLFTLIALAISALAGLGWDRLGSGPAHGARAVLSVLLVLTLTTLAAAVFQRAQILAVFHSSTNVSLFGPFDALAGYQAVIHGLGQAAIVFGLGFCLTILARRRPRLAGSAALVLMTADLAVANSRYVLTVPQSVFETKPEAVKVIEDAERADPSPGPFRIHRMTQWYPFDWGEKPSKDRAAELVSWERDTLNPKYGLDYGVEYAQTSGVAQLRDHEQFFTGFFLPVLDKAFALHLDVAVGEVVAHSPRRAYDIWNTRYMIVPFDANGWRDPARSFASFLFRSRQVFPDPDNFTGPDGTVRARNWAETRDFKVIRNLMEYPRAWIVHGARAASRFTGSPMGAPGETMQEILHAADPLWNIDGQRVYDPHNLAWVSRDDLIEINRYLTGRTTRPSEIVKVTYPSPQQAILEANLDSPGLVILADVYYPGWELTIDGEPAPIYRVNGSMRGAAVSTGFHRLVYTYRPQSFRVGRLVSIAGLAGLVVVGLACARWPVDPVLGGEDSSISGQKILTNQQEAGGW